MGTEQILGNHQGIDEEKPEIVMIPVNLVNRSPYQFKFPVLHMDLFIYRSVSSKRSGKWYQTSSDKQCSVVIRKKFDAPNTSTC